MIDIEVAMDKLKSFETADHIADYLVDCNVKGEPAAAGYCALARWLHDTTGERWYVFGTGAVKEAEYDLFNGVNEPPKIKHSPIIQQFIVNFDKGKYPELINKGTPYHG